MIWIWWHELLIPWQRLENLAWHLEIRQHGIIAQKQWRPFMSRREKERKANVFLDTLILINTSCRSTIETIHCSRLLCYVLYDLLMCVRKSWMFKKRLLSEIWLLIQNQIIVSQWCSCGSVVEHCVSNVGCGFYSQGTHILIKDI